VRLFCFHHAGGAQTMFYPWKRALAPGIEVMPVEIPNRERFATMWQLADEADSRLGSALDQPHMFFGHSFGALLAYRLACLRAARGTVLPRALFLSSYAPPHLPTPLPAAVDHLGNEQLAALLSDIGGMPFEVAQWPALRDRAVDAARIDLRLCATDDDSDTTTLSCPIYALGGNEDPLVSEADLQEWQSRTSGEFSVQILHGGHFYLSDGPQLFHILRPLMSSLAVA
jgi:surfactin synthase thioesterase subunit